MKPKTKLQPLSKLPILESWNNCFSGNNWEIGKLLPLKQLKKYFPRWKVCTLDNWKYHGYIFSSNLMMKHTKCIQYPWFEKNSQLLPLKQLFQFSKMGNLDNGCWMVMYLNVYHDHHNIRHCGILIYSMSKFMVKIVCTETIILV